MSKIIVWYSSGIVLHPRVRCSVVYWQIQNRACSGWWVDGYPEVDDVTNEFERVGVESISNDIEGFSSGVDKAHWKAVDEEVVTHDPPHNLQFG